ncbi:MAG: hypothetical protein LBQ61_04180, partial [Spirochaetales bacterium]|nr:hypothetical protein [Spirochaetales bacterium]
LGLIPGAAAGGLRLMGAKFAMPNMAGSLTKKILDRMGTRGVFWQAAVSLGLRTVTGAAEEGLEEALQEGASAAGRNYAAREENERRANIRAEQYEEAVQALGEGYSAAAEGEIRKIIDLDPLLKALPEEEIGQIFNNMVEAFTAGARVSLVLGVVPAGLNLGADIREYLAVQRDGISNPSQEAFIKNTLEKPHLWEDVPEETRREAAEQIYQSLAEDREANLAEEAEAAAEVGDYAPGTETFDDRDRPLGEVFRHNGRIHTEFGTAELEDGRTVETFKGGDGSRETRSNRYGTIFFSREGDEVRIHGIRMAPGREGLLPEFYRDFAETQAEKNIVWNPRSERAREIKADLERRTPEGGKGLNYFSGPEQAATAGRRARLAEQIVRLTKGKATALQAEVAIKELEILGKAGANAEAREVLDWFDITDAVPEGAEKAAAAAQDEGKIVKGLTQPLQNGRALVYLFENADASTLFHEFFHVAQLHFTAEQIGAALKAMGRETWDTAAKEDLARQFEGYLRTGEAPAAELKTLFDKIKEFMRAVYETLTGRIAVKPEVKEFFDQLHRGELSPKNAQNSPGETKTYRNSTEDPQASSEAPRTLSGGIVEGGAPYARSNGAWDMLDTPGIREFYDSLSPEEKAAFNRDREKNENRELKNKNANKKITPTPVQPGVGDDFSMLDKLGREAYTPFKEWVLEINPNKAINTETGLPFNFHARPEPKEGGAAVKSEKRTKEKIQEDREQNILKGKPELLDAQMENVLDYVGFTLTFDTIEELNNFADEIIQRPEVVRAKDRFRDSDLFTGYRDYLLNVKMPNGFVGELQLNVNGMLAAKEQKYGHSLYEITRDYWKYVRDGKMTAEEKAYDEAFINNIARELYDRAYAYALAERDFSTSGRDIPKHSEALGENPPDGFNDLSSITKNHLIPLLAKIEWSSATNLNSGSSNDGTTSLGSVLGEDLTNRNSGDSEAGASSLAISATSTPSITPIIGQNAGNVKGNVDISGIPPIREKYQKAKKTEGFEDTKNVGGEEIEGRWILTEAETPTASHDETTFNETRGFPSANGATINDRDYRHDQAAQEAVVKMAAGYDSRALEGVVITEDGIVISGNNRTMSGKLAAKNGTDGKYIASLEKKAKKYGFTAEQVREYTHPRLVFEVAVKGDYSTELFAQFNQSTRKAQSPVETAVKMAKRLSEKPQVARGIANTIDEHDTLAELYSDKKAVQEIFNILQKNGLIGAYEVPQYVDERGTITGAGVDLLESVMLGSVLNEGNIRGLQGSPAMRQKLVRGITALVENKAMGDYSFIPEMNEAVGIALAVHNTVGKDGKRIYGTVQDYVKQQILPGMPAGLSVEKRASIQLAEALESGGQKDFTLWFGGLNAQLAGAARGQAELLTGEVESKESILDRYVGYREKITERKEANQKTLTTPEAGLAAKTEAALDDAGIAKADAEGTLFQAAYHGTPHQVDRFSTEKIGTGEGAQAYGWGLYFAGRKEIADHYRKNLSLPKITIDGITYQRDHRNTQVYGTVAGTEFNEPVDTEGPLFYALVTLEGEDGNIEAAKTDIQMAILNDKHSKELIKLDKEALKILGKDIGYEAGHLYEVSIPEDDELLDWDKPLSEQPEKVKAALKNLAKSMPPGVFTESLQPFENTSGDGLYNALSRDTGSDKAASEALLSVGIPGLRYLDGSSRAAGKGSYNYVIFDDSEIEIAQTLFQTEEPSTPGKPWPENFPNVTQMSTVAKMKAHGDYAAAKAGDRDAAARLVLDIMGGKGQQEKLKALGEKHPDAIVVGVHAEERSGRNAIPRVLSEYIAKATGLEVDTDIVQSVKAGHTGSDAWRRMANRAQFDGEVQQGRKYILVDDVVTGGGTFGELRRYIEMNGGEVVDMVSMGAAQFSTNIALSEKTRLDLESRYGVELLQQFLQEEGLYGGEYRALTESEARTLLAAGSLDAARNRIAQARQQGNPRILQGSVQGRETPGNPQQVSPQLPKNNNPSTLFQLDESLLEDAARYDTWQDFREAYENQGESAVPSAGDAAWYETFWKDARKALGLPVEPQTLFQTGSKPAGPPERGDRNFLLDVDRETLNQILAALNKAL